MKCGQFGSLDEIIQKCDHSDERKLLICDFLVINFIFIVVNIKLLSIRAVSQEVKAQLLLCINCFRL